MGLHDLPDLATLDWRRPWEHDDAKEDATMPSKSPKQARMMAVAAHSPKFAKKVGVPVKVAKEFNAADAGTGILSGRQAKKGRGR